MKVGLHVTLVELSNVRQAPRCMIIPQIKLNTGTLPLTGLGSSGSAVLQESRPEGGECGI